MRQKPSPWIIEAFFAYTPSYPNRNLAQPAHLQAHSLGPRWNSASQIQGRRQYQVFAPNYPQRAVHFPGYLPKLNLDHHRWTGAGKRQVPNHLLLNCPKVSPPDFWCQWPEQHSCGSGSNPLQIWCGPNWLCQALFSAISSTRANLVRIVTVMVDFRYSIALQVWKKFKRKLAGNVCTCLMKETGRRCRDDLRPPVPCAVEAEVYAGRYGTG